jgi:TP901 family phage tail tape measure protein
MADVATLYLKCNSKEILVGKVSLEALGKAAKGTAKDVDKLTNKTETFAKKTKSSMSTASSSLKVVGRDISRYVTLPFAAASAASIKFATDLSQGLGQVETLIAGSGSRIYELKDLVTGLSAETGTSFDDLTRGLYETISAFQDGADTAGRFEAAVKASVAGNASVTDSVKLISAVTKAYGDTSEEAAEKVTDLAFQAVKYGQTTFAELSTAITKVTSNSDRLAVSQEELFGIYATLTGVTGDAAEVTTQFNRVLLSLANPTQELQALFSQYRTEQGEVVKTGEQFVQASGGAVGALINIRNAAEAGGESLQEYITRATGVTAAVALTDKQLDTFISKFAEVSDYAGSANEAFNTATKGIDEYRYMLIQAKQSIASSAAAIGDDLVPILAELATQLASAVERFAEMDSSARNTIIAVTAVVAAAGPLLIYIGAIVKAVSVLKGALAGLKLTSTIGSVTGLTGAMGSLAGILGPVGIAIAAVGVAIAGVKMYNWIKETKEQIEQLKALRQATMDFQDADTAFMKYYESLGDVSASTEVTADQTDALVKMFPELSKVVDDGTKSWDDYYKKLLDVQAAEFQQELGGWFTQLEDMNTKVKEVSDERSKMLASIEDDWGETFSKMGMSASEAVLKYQQDPSVFEDLFPIAPALEDQLYGLDSLTRSLDEKSAAVTEQINNWRDEVEARTGGKLTLFQAIETMPDGAQFDVTDFIKVIGNASIETKEDLEALLGSTGANGDGGESTRLKTWADYFADITGIAGEAFAQIEYDDEGKAVGFFRGSGKLAADAYGKAFKDELATSNLIASALGQSISSADTMDFLSDQIDTAVGDLNDLLSEKVRSSELNTEGLSFSIADLLTSDATSVEEMLSVFGLGDDTIQGMITVATLKIDEFATEAIRIAQSAVEKAAVDTPPIDIFGQGVFSPSDNSVAQIQSSIDTIDNLIEQVDAAGGDIKPLEFFKENQLDELKKASLQFGNVKSDLQNATDVSTVFATTLFDAFKDTENPTSNFNAALGATSIMMEGFISSALSGLGDLAYGLGQAAAGVGDWNDAMGELAGSIASTLAQLSMQVGMQLIGAGAAQLAVEHNPAGWGLIGMGTAFLAGGFAGNYAIGYSEGLTENADGGVYSNGNKLTAYANGGVLSDYSNSIVDTPTYFSNVMGEAGTEAIIPLTRSSNGELGVNASGVSRGGSNVNVSVNNYGNDKVEVTESVDSQGNVNLEMTVKKIMNRSIAQGDTDSAMRSRYGARVRGL